MLLTSLRTLPPRALRDRRPPPPASPRAPARARSAKIIGSGNAGARWGARLRRAARGARALASVRASGFVSATNQPAYPIQPRAALAPRQDSARSRATLWLVRSPAYLRQIAWRARFAPLPSRPPHSLGGAALAASRAVVAGPVACTARLRKPVSVRSATGSARLGGTQLPSASAQTHSRAIFQPAGTPRRASPPALVPITQHPCSQFRRTPKTHTQEGRKKNRAGTPPARPIAAVVTRETATKGVGEKSARLGGSLRSNLGRLAPAPASTITHKCTQTYKRGRGRLGDGAGAWLDTHENDTPTLETHKTNAERDKPRARACPFASRSPRAASPLEPRLKAHHSAENQHSCAKINAPNRLIHRAIRVL